MLGCAGNHHLPFPHPDALISPVAMMRHEATNHAVATFHPLLYQFCSSCTSDTHPCALEGPCKGLRGSSQ